MMVTVFFALGGGAAGLACGPSYLCGGCPATTGGRVFGGMAEATIIGSPPSGSSTTSAQATNVTTVRPSSPAIA